MYSPYVAIFYRKRLPQQNGDMRKRDLHAFKLYVEQGRLLSPPPPRPLPPTRDKRLAGPVYPASPPPPPTNSPWTKLVIFRDFGQKGGRPLFRGSKVMQLNSDSFCDYVRIWMEVIGHLWAKLGFWFFPEKGLKYLQPRTFDGREHSGRSCRYNKPVQYGRDAAHISLAVLRADPTWGLHGGEATPSERELLSRTEKESEAGDSAEPK